KRLSTAFDSVTLYGGDPTLKADVYGKIGNAGVSVCCLDDMKKLYSGFELCDPACSVSMTINGPAAILTAFFFQTAIDQQCEKYLAKVGGLDEAEKAIAKIYRDKGLPRPVYHGALPDSHEGLGLKLLGITGEELLPPEIYGRIRDESIRMVRGTVQADILKEDQAQNTCIFAVDFALRLMGDVEEYFIDHGVENFYSVSLSGYHIAEAGANPITQLAFTLANGLTLVEYYLSRGMSLNDFGAHLSFFFSCGMDLEYSVIGRVARSIWSRVMRDMYGADSRCQKLKYHIQTSGRSLHAQEIELNDIRTTLQALMAMCDSCNSLHTNAYDEAITTPTEDSVRRALAIQKIVSEEFGLSKNQNPLQGSYLIDQITELVEEEVLREFERLSDRGGVFGAMESMYQRNKIQSESLYYEKLKENGQLPIIGVNRFLPEGGQSPVKQVLVSRSTEDEKDQQVNMASLTRQKCPAHALKSLDELKHQDLSNRNIFEIIMELSKYCSLGQITEALYETGGQYRRNL
ncbi:MAG: methylmalonyl-CoA mutase family protein, partial [Spirochaetota bacterium]|nr:methylmalonyl-CoA mutase family protein [Spirochaetota bacterium]